MIKQKEISFENKNTYEVSIYPSDGLPARIPKAFGRKAGKTSRLTGFVPKAHLRCKALIKPSNFIIIALLLLLAAACKDGSNVTNNPPNPPPEPVPENRPPGAFTVTADITGLDPVLTWTAAPDLDGNPVTYSVLLDGEEVQAGISDTTATLEGLEHKTEFSGRVVASDDNGGSSEAEFTFTNREIRIVWEVNLGGSYSDIAQSIQQTSDGGYIVAGWSRSLDGDATGNNGDYDYWIVKIDANGGLIWENNFGGSDSDEPGSIRSTSDGGYIVAGWTLSSNGNVSGSNGGTDYWIVKLNTDGSLIWEKSFGGSGHDGADSIQQTSDGGYIMAGYSESLDGDVSGNKGSFDYWVVKLDADGSLVWEENLGGSGSDRAHSIQQTSDGGYIIAGRSASGDGDVTGNKGSYDYWVVKMDADGSLVWEENLGGSFSDEATSIQQTSDGGYIVAGWANSVDGDVTGNHGGRDYWIVKLDAIGKLVWEKSFGGSATFEKAYSIQQTSDGGYIVAGKSESLDGDVTGNNGFNDYWIVKLNADGELIWEKNLGGSSEDFAHSIQQTSDGGYIIAGRSGSMDGDVSDNNGNYDYWIVKLR